MVSGLRKVRLLTFNQLPDLAFSQDRTCLGDEMNQVTAAAIYFENHYLQLPGLKSITGGESSASVIGLIQQTLEAKGLSAAAVFCGESDAYAEFQNLLPACFDSHFAGAGNYCGDGSLSASQAGALQKSDFVWIHCDRFVIPPADEDVAAAVFRKQVQFCQDNFGDHGDVLVLITAVNGTSCPPAVPFESRLFDGEVHVPLWVTGSDVPVRRVQAVSGSQDIAFTVSEYLAKHDAVEGAGQQGTGTVCDLRKLYLNPGSDSARSLIVETDESLAIRTNDFLFVKSKEDGGLSGVLSVGEVALYAKPRDVWNFNDVSAEYMQRVQEFARLVD